MRCMCYCGNYFHKCVRLRNKFLKFGKKKKLNKIKRKDEVKGRVLDNCPTQTEHLTHS